jgi:cysteinyl-tRNA synthetase
MCAEFINNFTNAINNDLNTSEALATMQNLLKSDLPAKNKLSTIYKMDEVFGLNLDGIAAPQFLETVNLNQDVKKIVEERDLARKEKNFALADKLRKELESKGFEVTDSPGGTKLKNNS